MQRISVAGGNELPFAENVLLSSRIVNMLDGIMRNIASEIFARNLTK